MLWQQKRINQASAKYQSKGPIYILNLLAFAEISLFSCIFGKEKTKFGIAIKKVWDVGFS